MIDIDYQETFASRNFLVWTQKFLGILPRTLKISRTLGVQRSKVTGRVNRFEYNEEVLHRGDVRNGSPATPSLYRACMLHAVVQIMIRWRKLS